MEVKNIYDYTRWFVSYMRDDETQAKALILCQQKKIKQLGELIGLINMEIELAENPKEYSAETILQSIKAMISKIPEVSHTEGYFKWIA